MLRFLVNRVVLFVPLLSSSEFTFVFITFCISDGPKDVATLHFSEYLESYCFAHIIKASVTLNRPMSYVHSSHHGLATSFHAVPPLCEWKGKVPLSPSNFFLFLILKRRVFVDC